MPLQTCARCDVPGCPTPSVYGISRGGLEFDLTTGPGETLWEITCDVVRCPACVAADRWPEAEITTVPRSSRILWVDPADDNEIPF